MRIDVLTMFRDETFALLNEGYAFVPNRRLTANADMVYLRALGRRIVAASGQRWAEQFCDEQSVQRGSEAESAVPPGPRADEAGRRHRPAIGRGRLISRQGVWTP